MGIYSAIYRQPSNQFTLSNAPAFLVTFAGDLQPIRKEFKKDQNINEVIGY
jgi:hypothetical protein